MKLFDQVRLNKPSKNKFDLSHERKLSMKMGDLVPIGCTEIVPGDRFRQSTELMMRMMPLLAPVMHRVNVTVHNFFVPTRLIWDEFEDYITGGRLGTSAPVHPQCAVTNTIAPSFTESKLADYLGMPTNESGASAGTTVNISLLPFRAYQLIWDEYYRDQNVTASLDISKASGILAPGAELDKLLTLRKRAWEKDYFTSALPFAQRGNTSVIPGFPSYKATTDIISPTPSTVNNPIVTGGPVVGTSAKIANSTGNLRIENIDEIQINVQDLRRSIRLQEWLEKNALGGARYIESILAHFGVRSSDARLQRPEYLGGGRAPMVISEVLSTLQQVNPDDSAPVGAPQANLAGKGTAYGNGMGYSRSFEEHGYVVSLLSVLPKTAYQQGIPKMFRRLDKFDWYWPEFAQIGEQEVKNSEVFYDWNAAGTPDGVFGYQSRYCEYKYLPSTVHGAFKSTLAFWHMGRIFASAPALNESFITSDPTARIFAVTDDQGDHLLCQVYHKIDAIRPMPYFGTPTL